MFELKNRCYNGGKKHKFSPRYTEVPNNREMRGVSGADIRSLLFYKKYVGEVCEWCGKIVGKEKENGKDKSES